MSKATKRKHVTKEAVEDYYIPEGDEEIVKIIAGRGNNLHQVENAFGKHFLVSMPTKFRRNIWVKRGDYVVMLPIKEGNKVQGEIVYILLAKQIKYLKSENLWPKEFEDVVKDENDSQDAVTNGDDASCSGSDSESTDDELFENPNHPPVYYYDSNEECSSEEQEDEEEEDKEEESNKETVMSEKSYCSKGSGLEDAVARVRLK